MGFQTSASRCILPRPQPWHESKPLFYLTGHGGGSLFSQLSSIRGPCMQAAVSYSRVYKHHTFTCANRLKTGL